MVTAQQCPGIGQAGLREHRNDVPRHDIPAFEIAETTPINMHLGLQEQLFEILPIDVDEIAIVMQDLVDIGGYEAQPIARRLADRRRRTGGDS